MVSRLKNYLPLFKLRICSVVALSAVAGLVAASAHGVKTSAAEITALVLASLASSMGVSAFNHFFDRDIDSVMARTSARPLPSGRLMDARLVLGASALIFAASVAFTYFSLNWLAALHIFLGGFVYAVVYTVWLKRRSWLNIVVGGLAGSFAVLAGGASSSTAFCLAPVLLAVVMFFWTPSHFWSFAIVHGDDYRRAGVPMLPNIVGRGRTAVYILVNTVMLAASSLVPAALGVFGPVYAAIAAGLGLYFIRMNLLLIRDASIVNARRNFRASMVYLAGLFLAVAVDCAVRS